MTRGRMRAWLRVVVLLVPFALAFSVWRTFEADAEGGTQQCNTECQSKMTDCVLACDGIRSCEEACKRKAEGCVRVCTAPPVAPLVPIVDASDDVQSPDVQIVDAPVRDRAAARAARGDR